MPTEPEIKMLSYQSRSRFFKLLLVVFIIALPTFIFYTTGFRISFENEETSIVTTGGMYVTTDNLEVDVYLDEELIERPRLFRSAYYIQNIAAGQHRVVVQREGLHTWVKELPIDPYIVTEADAFNLPITPVIRPIPEFETTEGVAVFFASSTADVLFPGATTTEEYIVLTRRATTTLTSNPEFAFVKSLFGTSTASSTILSLIEEEIERFTFATTTETTATTTPEVFVERGNIRLVKRDDELFARWVGAGDATPHYFCTPIMSSSSVALRYGTHFADQIEAQRLSTTSPLHIEGDRECRTEIRVDRKWQDILYFEFFPNASDLVVLQLQDGLYVTEIDDRSWQNTQKVYTGDSFRTFVTDTNIYIEESGRFFELLTRIE